jgi:hypothetical protein
MPTFILVRSAARPRPLSAGASRVLLAALVLAAAAGPAGAQYTQYTEPGELALAEPPEREGFERAMEEARWRIGGLRLEPWFGVHDAGWMDNVFGVEEDAQSDFTVTVGAGLYGYTHVGSKLVLAAHALPEYVWWNELEDRRAVNGRYGAGLFAFFNRLTVELSATAGRRAEYLSSEVEQVVNIRRDQGVAAFDIDLPGRVSLFGAGSATSYRYREEDIAGPAGEQLVLLDRDLERLRGGLRVALSSRLRVGAGVEATRTAFDRPERDRSNSGSGPLLELELDGTRWRGRLVAVKPELEPEEGSSFVPFDDLLGQVQLSWQPHGRLEWQLYGFSNLVYSTRLDSPYYEDRRAGLAARMPVSWRASLRLFGETGRNDYTAASGAPGEQEELIAYGASVRVDLGRKAALTAGVSQTEYELDDRSVLRIQAGLSIGAGHGEWY